MEIRYIILSLFFNPDQLLCGAPSLLLNGYWRFSPVVKSLGLMFITQLHLVPRSISLPALYTSMAWAETTFFFPFAMRDVTSENFVNYQIILLLKFNPNTQVSRWFSFRRELKKKKVQLDGNTLQHKHNSDFMSWHNRLCICHEVI